MPARIPTPADFREQAHRTTRDLAGHYGVTMDAIRTFRRRLGLPQMPPNSLPRVSRQMPDDFMQHATKMPVTALARHYKVADEAARDWYRQAGLHRPRKRAPMPADFAQNAAGMTCQEARSKYNICYGTLYRWEAATGVKCIRECGGEGMRRAAASRVKPPKAPKSPKQSKPPREKTVEFVRAAPPPRKIHKARATAIRTDAPQRDMTRAGQAADFLRRIAPVYRCNDVGAQSIGGKFWRYGNSLPLTDAELVERAVRKGFDPDAWMRVAA